MFKIELPQKENMHKNSIMFNIIICILIIIIFSCCLKDDSINDGYIKYLNDNKNMIFLHLVDVEATMELFRVLNIYEENIFNENGEITYNIASDNMLLGLYRINNNFNERFLRYIIFEKKAIQIGGFIDEIRGRKCEHDIIVSFYLNPEGSKLFNEYTTSNVGKDIAIVFDNKIIFSATIFYPLEKTINILIDY